MWGNQLGEEEYDGDDAIDHKTNESND